MHECHRATYGIYSLPSEGGWERMTQVRNLTANGRTQPAVFLSFCFFSEPGGQCSPDYLLKENPNCGD